MNVSQNWRLEAQRYSLVGEECPHCKTKIFPPRDVCPECAQPAQELYKLSGKGEVYSYTVVLDAPEGFEEYQPYTIALVKLDEGPMEMAQLTDYETEPQIGDRVEMVTRRLRTDGDQGIIVYGYKFRPLLRPEA